MDANVRTEPGVFGMDLLPIVLILGFVFRGMSGVISTFTGSCWWSSVVDVHCEFMEADLLREVEDENCLSSKMMDSPSSSMHFVVIVKSNPVPEMGPGINQKIGHRPSTDCMFL